MIRPCGGRPPWAARWPWGPGGGRPGRAPGPAGADARQGRQHAAHPRPGQRIAVAPLVRPPAAATWSWSARPAGLEVVKRVVGLPGERVRLGGRGWRSTGRPSPSRTWPAGPGARPAPRAGRVPGARRPPGGQHRRPRLRPRRGRRPPRPGPLRLLAPTAPAPPGLDCAERREVGGMMLVVVAGGAGFLGASLVDRLQAEGDELVVVDDLSHGHLANLAEARRRGGVRFHRMDVAQGGLATLADRVRADAWVHLATAIDPVRAWEDPTGEARAVVPGGIEVLRAAAATGARAVLVSSGAYLYPAQLTGATRPGDSPARCTPRARPGWPWRPTPARSRPAAWTWSRSSWGRSTGPAGPARPRPGGQGRLDDAPGPAAPGGRRRPPGARLPVRGRRRRRGRPGRPRQPAPGRVLVGTGTATGVLDVVEQLSARIGWAGEPQWAPARPGDPRRSALDPAAAGKASAGSPGPAWTRASASPSTGSRPGCPATIAT